MTHSMSTIPALQGFACLPVGREVFPAGLLNAPMRFSYSLIKDPTRAQKMRLRKSSNNDFDPAIQRFSDFVFGIYQGHCLTMK